MENLWNWKILRRHRIVGRLWEVVAYERWSHMDVRLRCYYKYPMVLHRAAMGTMESRFALPLRSFSSEYAREKKIARRVSKRLKALLTISTMVHVRQTASFWFNFSRFIRSSWFQVLNILTRRGRGGTQQKVFYRESQLRDPRGPYPYLFIHRFLTEIVICNRLPYFQSIEIWYLLYIPTNWKSPHRHFLPWGATQRILILAEAPPRGLPLY